MPEWGYLEVMSFARLASSDGAFWIRILESLDLDQLGRLRCFLVASLLDLDLKSRDIKPTKVERIHRSTTDTK